MPDYIVRSNIVDIDAPVETAWSVLADTDRYGEWNPFTPSVRTDLAMGSEVHMLVTMGPGRIRQTEIVCMLEPPNLLAWRTTMGGPRMLHALRRQHLEARDGGGCRYHTTDEFTGLLAPVVMLFAGGFVRRGFNAVAWGLKKRAEELHRTEH